MSVMFVARVWVVCVIAPAYQVAVSPWLAVVAMATVTSNATTMRRSSAGIVALVASADSICRS